MPDRLLLRRVNRKFFWNPNLKALPGDVALKPGGEVAANDGKTFTIFFRGVNEGWWSFFGSQQKWWKWRMWPFFEGDVTFQSCFHPFLIIKKGVGSKKNWCASEFWLKMKLEEASRSSKILFFCKHVNVLISYASVLLCSYQWITLHL